MIRWYKTHFSAAHRISGHDKCGNIHGHNYILKVGLSVMDDWFDFAWIKEVTEKVIARLDHGFDGKDEPLPDDLSTVEQLCLYLEKQLAWTFDELGYVKKKDVFSIRVELSETPNFWVSSA